MARPLVLDPADLREYVARDWGGAREGKREYWRTRLGRGDLDQALRITEQLRDWMKLADPSWPTPKQREEDIETHRRVAQCLAATAPPPAKRTRAPRPRSRRVR